MERENIPLGDRFLLLEELLDGADAGFLRECVACDDGERFFRAPLNALGSFGVVFAKVTAVDGFGFGVKHHGAVVAGFDAPAAAVAFVFVKFYVSCFFILF